MRKGVTLSFNKENWNSQRLLRDQNELYLAERKLCHAIWLFYGLTHNVICLFFLSESVVISSDEEDPGAEGGDEYEGDRESDSEIDEDDLWACSQCNLKNHPMSRQCARCWTERHEWLPHLKRQVFFAVYANHFMNNPY